MPPLDHSPSYFPPPSHGHTRVSYRREPNFLQRVGNSLVGSVIGLLMVGGACVLLFWNEVICTLKLMVAKEYPCSSPLPYTFYSHSQKMKEEASIGFGPTMHDNLLPSSDVIELF